MDHYGVLQLKMASPGEAVGTNGSAFIDFPEHLRTLIQRMRDDESSNDVVFVVENDRFPAHHCLMRAACPFLRDRLPSGTNETYPLDVSLKGVSVKVWKAVLDYIYTDKIELPDVETAVKILKFAVQNQMVDPGNFISDCVTQELDTSNCTEILATADG